MGQQLAEFDHLLDAEGKMPGRTFKVESQLVVHDIGGGEGFAEVGQEAFAVEVIHDSEQLAWGLFLFGLRFGVEIETEGALGRFIKLLRSLAGMAEVGSISGGLGVALNIG
jgi:hypothetical protein